jgi:RNase P subunit RPR2
MDNFTKHIVEFLIEKGNTTSDDLIDYIYCERNKQKNKKCEHKSMSPIFLIPSSPYMRVKCNVCGEIITYDPTNESKDDKECDHVPTTKPGDSVVSHKCEKCGKSFSFKVKKDNNNNNRQNKNIYRRRKLELELVYNKGLMEDVDKVFDYFNSYENGFVEQSCYSDGLSTRGTWFKPLEEDMDVGYIINKTLQFINNNNSIPMEINMRLEIN